MWEDSWAHQDDWKEAVEKLKKDGKVKHIRTGFEGPGTGIYYEQFKQRFNELINELLTEKHSAEK